jgi:ferredoxin--NADP+ reductase
MSHVRELEPTRRFRARVLESERITPAEHREEVRHILLEVELPEVDFAGYETVGVFARGHEELGAPEVLRLYAIAGAVAGDEGRLPRVELCVRRCFYIDDFNGEEYPGLVSSYLCDRKVGDVIDLTGPFGIAFTVPEDPESDLVMIGQGTGIAPFRTLVRRIYQRGEAGGGEGAWKGRVRLFHGAVTGLDLLYRNDENQDLGLYMSHETFEAIEALSPRPHFGELPALGQALVQNAEEVLEMIGHEKTHVYVAGLRAIGAQLDAAFADLLDSTEAWQERKNALRAAGRWHELLY